MSGMGSWNADRKVGLANEPERWKRPCRSSVKVGAGESMGLSAMAHDGAIVEADKDSLRV